MMNTQTIPVVSFEGSPFRLHQPFPPAGDQPDAIAKLVEGLEDGLSFQTLLGVTGSGKTYTMANVIAQTGRPALILAPNKTLAAQFATELREFFPDTALPLEQILRSIVGLDHAAVEARFASFAGRYPLSSQQLRFLTLLKDHIRQYGAIATDTLFEAPFTSVHTEGLSGVFHDETQFDELIALIRSFGPTVTTSQTPNT